jgi:hypothetical protein
MEYEGESGKAGAGNVVGIVRGGDAIRAEFVDRQKSRLGLGDRSDVVVLTSFSADGNAEFIEGLMQQVLDGSEAGHIID